MVDRDVVWHKTRDFFFEKNTLFATVFFANTLVDPAIVKRVLNQVYTQWHAFLEPWQDMFVWTEDLPQTSLRCYKPSNGAAVDYIELRLPFGDCTTDEWLAVALLLRFFSQYLDISAIAETKRYNIGRSDFYIHFLDEDGEFVLMETHDAIPRDWVPDTCVNRVWFNGTGDMLFIGHELTQNSGALPLHEALDTIETSAYKMQKLTGARDKLWRLRVQTSVQTSLSLVTRCEIECSAKLWRAIDQCPKNANVLCKAFSGFLMEQFGARVPLKSEHSFEDESQLETRVVELPLVWYAALQQIFAGHGESGTLFSSFPELARAQNRLSRFLGLCLSSGFSKLHKSGTWEQPHEPEPEQGPEPQPSQTNAVGVDDLQSVLISRGVISEKVATMGLAEFEKHKTVEEFDVDDFDLNEMYNDDSDYTSDNNAEVLEYFKDEQVSIDEDDFFEYFVTQELGVSQSELENLRTDNAEESDEEDVYAMSEKEFKELRNKLKELHGSMF